jgi:hypothetical protein
LFPGNHFPENKHSQRKNTFLETKPNFSLTGKCFPLTNFPNGKQTQESLESGFPESEFQETNMALIAFLACKATPTFYLNNLFLTLKIKPSILHILS